MGMPKDLVRCFKNVLKRRYAEEYYKYAIGKRKTEPKIPRGLSMMAAQSVMWKVNEFVFGDIFGKEENESGD